MLPGANSTCLVSGQTRTEPHSAQFEEACLPSQVVCRSAIRARGRFHAAKLSDRNRVRSLARWSRYCCSDWRLLRVALQQDSNSDKLRRTETNADGTESMAEINETADPKTGITHQVETRNGKPQTDWVIQRNPDGTGKDRIVYADGSYNERERRSDGTTVEDRYSAQTRSHTYQKSDTQRHLIEVITQSDSHYIRCTYSFDKDGRSTGQINYDAAGNILDKSTAEYRNDSHGNWVEKKSIVWDTRADPMQPKIVLTTLRTINYY